MKRIARIELAIAAAILLLVGYFVGTAFAQTDLVKIGKAYILYLLDIEQDGIPVGGLIYGDTANSLKALAAADEGYGLFLEGGYPKWKEAAAGEWDDLGGYLKPKDADQGALAEFYRIVSTAYEIYKNDSGDLCFKDENNPGGLKFSDLGGEATRDVIICFAKPSDGLEESFQLQVDDNTDFGSLIIETSSTWSQSGWKCSLSNIWNAFPGGGKLSSTYDAKSIAYATSYIYSTDLNVGTEYYGRVRAEKNGDVGEWRLFSFRP